MDENKILRELLWLNHGCKDLYGDDGEMQCGKCMIDFKTNPASQIKKRFEQITERKIIFVGVNFMGGE